MIVSTSSWHYRLYAWTKSRWSNFEDKSFILYPDLCSYIATILLQAPVIAVIWVIAQIIDGVGNLFARVHRSAVLRAVAYLVGFMALSVFIAWAKSVTHHTTILHEMPDAMLDIVIMCGAFAVFGAVVVGGVFAFITTLVFVAETLARIPSGIRKAKTTPFMQLATTWTRDKWRGTICRTLTFVD